MRTRENSTIISQRVEKELNEEFVALAKEIGILPSRRLRSAFLQMLDEMRLEANKRREERGDVMWEQDWVTKNVTSE